MKKIFTILALVAAMLTNVNAAVPSAVQRIIDEGNKVLAGESAEGMTFQAIFTEGQNVVFPIVLDDSQLVAMGYRLSQAIDMMGGQEAFRTELISGLFEGETDEDLLTLKENRYNIVFRLKGGTSGDVIDLKVNYFEF